MPKGYQHLTREQRCQIAILKATGFTQNQIAEKLAVSASSISRELKRNQSKSSYEFHEADVAAQTRRWKASTRPRKMTTEIIEKIERYLKEDWSPEQISGRLTLEGIRISHERIYQHVWADKKNWGALYKHLRHHGIKYNKRSAGKAGRGCIQNRVDIREPPEIVNTKSRLGDWEGDTIIGAKHQGAILSYVDRKSKFTILEKLSDKTAENVINATIKRFSKFKSLTHTITYDNGQEFSGHQRISKEIGASCYFATPYHSWERGLNEHTNGLVRQYIPKSSNLRLVTDQKIKEVEERLNNRPRKVLDYRTPKEVFLQGLHIL
jgi:IS30 family transposase